MKGLQLFTVLMLFSTFISFGQVNRSDSLVVSNFNGASPSQQFGGQEIFRFQPGVVTQLNNGNGFGFMNDRWFSIGELTTQPSGQTVFGLRFQLPNRALTYGYQDIGDDNPRIQWIDDRNGPGDLEFRFADDFTSTNSNLIATMTGDGQLVLPPKNSSSYRVPRNDKMEVANRNFRNGINVSTNLISNEEGTAEGVGIKASAGFNDNNIAVRGIAIGGFSINKSINIAIEGDARNGGYAGFFNGDVNVTGTFTNPSDRKLKDDIKPTKDALEKITGLSSYTFTFKENDDLNLPQGLQHGLISQELEKVYPELVKETTYPIYNEEDELQGTGSYKSVNYIGLISELTAAVNELNQKVEDLKASKTTLVYSSQFTEEELAKIRANGYQLEQNIPNPFSGATSIQYSLPEKQPAGFYHDL